MFGRTWLMVAHLDELAEPGDYRLVDQIPEPVVLVRGDRRRGPRLLQHVPAPRRRARRRRRPGNTGRRLTCPYHSWVYDLDGALVGYPEAHNFPDLDRDCLALRSVRCETWGPLVFVNLDDDAPPLPEFLGAGRRRPQRAGRPRRPPAPRRATRASRSTVNWKLPVDANIETYHVNTVHRDTAAQLLDQAATGHPAPARTATRACSSAPTTAARWATCMPFAPLFDGVGDLPDAGTFSFHVFPNLSIVFSGRGFVFFITNWPIGPEPVELPRALLLVAGRRRPSEDAQLNEAFAEINRSVLLEDLSVLPGMQRSIDSGGARPGPARLPGAPDLPPPRDHRPLPSASGVPDHLRVPPMLADHIEA